MIIDKSYKQYKPKGIRKLNNKVIAKKNRVNYNNVIDKGEGHRYTARPMPPPPHSPKETAAMYTLLLTALYILAIAFIYAPQCPSAAAAINYFPDPQPDTPKSQPMPKPAYTATVPKPKAIAQSLETMPIRSLYQLASDRKIKGYKAMKKAELVAALA